MAYATTQDYDLGVVLGRFIEASHGKLFEYGARDEVWRQAFAPDFPNVVWVGPLSERRAALVRKTVAYIVTDEAADGSPVVERWEIKQHKRYK